ncbi:H+transporting two-sector ATPase B/B' subunit [Novosphingobium nitrogenifigens DSM 19370]|uniref:ATP synthase subunit b n=1 Tax=Novosphingobium nitrogenifigens DSM 19370 TaxID=983920 RepID=F1ZAB4_9SPHN|nr:hypothetical protein [Novosphingobium nitrogenifigens]EGD58478.1 H+transporting two-sector ATPase B/B' subunit [Novosphingobium nitrogenifigens DSM 19370]
MTIDWWTLGLQTINLLVLVALLGHFLLKPLAAIVAARQAEAQRLLDEAASARDQAQSESKALDAERDKLAAEKAATLAAAEAEAQEQRKALLDGARAEADTARAEAEAKAKGLLAEADSEIGLRARLLAADITARLLARAPGLTRAEAWLPGLVEALGALPDATRARIAQGPITLTFARTPDEATRQTCRQTLETALGQTLDLTFAEDPTLIAGLELSSADAIVRNNLRADLDHIATREDHDERG